MIQKDEASPRGGTLSPAASPAAAAPPSPAMAKIILVALAALCALAAVSGVPVLGEASQQQQLSAGPAFVRSWPTEILKAIELALQALQDEIQQTLDEAEDAVRKVLQAIEDSALELADKWNARLQEWVDKANQAGVDISDCIKGQNDTLADVVEKFRLDARQCLADSITDLKDEIKELRSMGPEIHGVLQNATDVVTSCIKQGNPIKVIKCLSDNVPTVQIKIAGLSARVLLQVGVVAAKAATLQPSTALCTATALARASAQGSAVVDATVSCIEGKLNPPSRLH